jgi:hypothetical protein
MGPGASSLRDCEPGDLDPSTPLHLNYVLRSTGDLARVSNLVRSLGRAEITEVVSVEKNLTAAERVELEKFKMLEEKERAKAEMRAQRLAGPQPLIPGLVSNPEESSFTLIMILVTLFSLWGVDTYNMLVDNPIENDLSFYTAVLICFLFFALEFVFYTLFKPGYFRSFFFYLDFVSTVSLVPDFLLLWNIQAFGDSGDSGTDTGGQNTIARAGRAARAGTRAARIVRVFKALTLVKKSKQKGMKPASFVGQLVNDGIQRKIIVIVATMLVVSEILLMIADEDSFKKTQTSFGEVLVNMQVMLTVAGGDVRAEPFASSMVRFINHFNCISYSDQGPDRPCPESCQIDASSLGGMEETKECDVRYIRIDGVDVYGYGPSERTWRYQLTAALTHKRHDSCMYQTHTTSCWRYPLTVALTSNFNFMCLYWCSHVISTSCVCIDFNFMCV